MTLQGKQVFIVGGSSGIGLAAAQLALEQGAVVTIASSSPQRLEQAKASLHGSVKTVHIDILHPEEVKTFFASYHETIDHLVISNPSPNFRAFLEMEVQEVRQLFEGKFWGPYHVARYGAERVAIDGSLTLFSGINVVSSRLSPLAAVNAAINDLGRSLAIELAPRRVNVVCPGVIDTPLRAAWPGEVRRGMYTAVAQQTPLGRIGASEEVAQGVIYILNNPFVTGTILKIDGGLELM